MSWLCPFSHGIHLKRPNVFYCWKGPGRNQCSCFYGEWNLTWERESLKSQLSTPGVRIYPIITVLSPQGLSLSPVKSTWLHHAFFRKQPFGGLFTLFQKRQTGQAGDDILSCGYFPFEESRSACMWLMLETCKRQGLRCGELILGNRTNCELWEVGSVVLTPILPDSCLHCHLHHHLPLSSLSCLGLVLLIKTLELVNIYHPCTLWQPLGYCLTSLEFQLNHLREKRLLPPQ